MFPTLRFRYLWYSDEDADDAVVEYEILQAGKPLASQDGTVPWADLVPNYKAKRRLAGDALADERDAAMERLADAWWEQLYRESPS